MCLIVSSQTGEIPEDGVLRYAYKQNDDGWGIVYHDGLTTHVEKGTRTNSLIRAVHRVKGMPYILHLRYATHGKVDRHNTHPFRIGEKLWMAHNGVLSINCPNKDRSDTWHFARLLEDIMIAEPDWYNTPSFEEETAAFIGKSNKLAFMDATGKIKLVNESAGTKVRDMWFSQTYSLPVGYEYGDDWDEYDDDDVDILSYGYGHRGNHRTSSTTLVGSEVFITDKHSPYYGASGTIEEKSLVGNGFYVRHDDGKLEYYFHTDFAVVHAPTKRESEIEQEQWWKRELEGARAYGSAKNRVYYPQFDPIPGVEDLVDV